MCLGDYSVSGQILEEKLKAKSKTRAGKGNGGRVMNVPAIVPDCIINRLLGSRTLPSDRERLLVGRESRWLRHDYCGIQKVDHRQLVG